MTEDFIRPTDADVDLVADIAAMMKSLDEPVPVPGPRTVFRVVVATDWSNAAVAFAALTGYAAIIPAQAPVELVFAVPHDVTQADLAAVTTLCEGLSESDPEVQIAGLGLESFGEAAERHAYAAIVPTGDQDALTMELTHFFIALHHLADTVRDPQKLAAEPAPARGRNVGLDRRLAEYRETPRTLA